MSILEKISTASPKDKYTCQNLLNSKARYVGKSSKRLHDQITEHMKYKHKENTPSCKALQFNVAKAASSYNDYMSQMKPNTFMDVDQRIKY